jgi:hypothetical protein
MNVRKFIRCRTITKILPFFRGGRTNPENSLRVWSVSSVQSDGVESFRSFGCHRIETVKSSSIK